MPRVAQITAHPLRECHISTEKWNHFASHALTEDWLRDDDFREKWHSPTCLLFNPADGLVYVGLTALNGDIFYTFDPRTEAWESLRYPTGGDRCATKIHVALQLGADGWIYSAVATLADVDVWPRPPGGPLFRFDPRTRAYDFLGVPLPHDYIQGILLDAQRGLIYGHTFPGRRLFRFDLATRQARELTCLGNVSTEHLALDAAGGLWHHYELAQWAGRYPLLRYDPDQDRIDYLNLDLPDLLAGNRAGGQIDTALTTRDGTLYLGTASGALFELDHHRPRLVYLGKPFPAPRLKGLLEAPDGLLYGVAGARYDTHFFAYDRARGQFLDLGPLMDERAGARCWLGHDLCQIDARTFLVAECDNHERASHLFKIQLEVPA